MWIDVHVCTESGSGGRERSFPQLLVAVLRDDKTDVKETASSDTNYEAVIVSCHNSLDRHKPRGCIEMIGIRAGVLLSSNG